MCSLSQGPGHTLSILGSVLHLLTQESKCGTWAPESYPSKPGTHLLTQMGLSLNISYLSTQLQERGVYKAMSEFDIFINYIETYMTLRMKI